MREGRTDEMAALVDDDLLAEVAVSEADGDTATLLRRRYEGNLVQRVLSYEAVPAQADARMWRERVRRLRGKD